MISAARDNGVIDDPLIRQRLASYHSKVQITRINGLRSLTVSITGRKDPAVSALGATNKLWWSEMHQEGMELALDVYGAEAMLRTCGPESWPATMRSPSSPVDYSVTPMLSAWFFSRSETIWGGSSQIQRNIVGERVLGLPKEPKVPSK
jgi:alkylation response protein AidB-like acyl-CoA dehydrogenase